jgi:hypothetical protein
VGSVEVVNFFDQMFEFPSRLARGWPRGGGSSLVLILGLLAVAALWTISGFSLETFAVAGLANVAALGLGHYAVALATGRLFGFVSVLVLGASALLAVALRERRRGARPAPPGLTPWDGVSILFLAILLVPTVFPYIHFDAKEIWAARAYAMEQRGFADAILASSHPTYPPVFSILLWLGIGDPVFEGRLLPVVVAVLFALFLRARAARLSPAASPAATLFFVSTVHVWHGTAMYYADTLLMAFLSGGILLILGLPRSDAGGNPTRGELAAGALLLSGAMLVRPDGLYYLCVAAAVVSWTRLRGGMLAVRAWPCLAAAAAWVSWEARPASLHGATGFLFRETDGWRALGDGPIRAVFATFVSFLHSLQGQWLSHKGLGAALYAFALAALWLRRRPSSAAWSSNDARFFGAVTALSFAAVALCYIVIPFTGDIVLAVQPFETTEWEACYRNFVRVGAGRMTVHLFPFLVLYVAAAAATIVPSRDSARSIESFDGPNEKRT